MAEQGRAAQVRSATARGEKMVLQKFYWPSQFCFEATDAQMTSCLVLQYATAAPEPLPAATPKDAPSEAHQRSLRQEQIDAASRNEIALLTYVHQVRCTSLGDILLLWSTWNRKRHEIQGMGKHMDPQDRSKIGPFSQLLKSPFSLFPLLQSPHIRLHRTILTF